jgi:tryptophanyl-tRNA synthetase
VDEPDVIRKKIMKAKTDAGPTTENQEKPQEIVNLFTILKHVSPQEVCEHFEHQYNNCTIRYGDFKKQLAEDVVNFCAPIRERILELSSNDVYLDKVMKEGAEKARVSGRKTLADVRGIIGFRDL